MVALVFKHFLLISIRNNMENSTCREYTCWQVREKASFLSLCTPLIYVSVQIFFPSWYRTEKEFSHKWWNFERCWKQCRRWVCNLIPRLFSFSYSMGWERGLGMKLGGFLATWQSLVAVLLKKTKFTLQLVLLFIELTKVGTRVEEMVASLTTILEEDKKREKEIQVW